MSRFFVHPVCRIVPVLMGAALLGLHPSPASAGTFFSAVAVASNSVTSDYSFALGATTASRTVNSVYGTAAASAELGTGELRTRLDLTDLIGANFGALAVAGFGDSFHLNGFDGLSNFGLSLDISGAFNFSGDVANHSYIGFYLVQPGRLQSVIDAGFPFDSSDYLGAWEWGIGPSPQRYSNFPRTFVASYNSFPRTISLGFNPGGDFDWYVLMRLDGSAAQTGAFVDIDADFSHTAGVSFSVPAGVTIDSASGVFPLADATAVPEPSTWLLLAGGGVLLGLCRARRVSKQD